MPMRSSTVTLTAWLCFAGFDALAAPRTMRLDFYHSGNATQELFSVDRVVIEPLEWPGNPEQAIDRTNLGKYLFDVTDQTGRVLYSRGFASIYGEWETTDEAKTLNRTFHESIRFPAPEAAVKVIIRKRDARNQFQQVWTAEVDPRSMFVDDSTPPAPGAVIAIERNGEPATKVDVLLLGDGYTAAEGGNHVHTQRCLLRRVPPRHRGHHRALRVVAEELAPAPAVRSGRRQR